MSCADVASEAIRISKGEVVAINNQTSTSKTDHKIVCHGVALTSDGRELPARFQAFESDNGDILVKYDTDEYQAAQDAQARREAQQEEAQAEQEGQQMVDQAMRQGRAEAAAETY